MTTRTLPKASIDVDCLSPILLSYLKTIRGEDHGSETPGLAIAEALEQFSNELVAAIPKLSEPGMAIDSVIHLTVDFAIRATITALNASPGIALAEIKRSQSELHRDLHEMLSRQDRRKADRTEAA